MPGGLIQLVAFGAQNYYLNGNPSVSFFKKVYKTYTNFSMESMKVIFNKNFIQFNESTKLIAKIPRNADLIQEIYFSFELPNIKKQIQKNADNVIIGDDFRYVKHLGEVMIDNYFIYIGGTIVDTHYGEWLHIWNELSIPSSKKYGYDKMIGNIPEMYLPDAFNQKFNQDEIQIHKKRFYVPLTFWFNKNPGLALPLIALQYHEIEIHIELRPYKDLFTVNEAKQSTWEPYFENSILNINPNLEVNYIFLDTNERNYFAKTSQDYLIEQVKRIPLYNIKQFDINELNIQNPVKEIIWVCSRNDVSDFNTWFEYIDNQYVEKSDYMDDDGCTCRYIVTEKEILTSATLLLNGIERFEEKDGSYFNLIQPYQYHTVIPKAGIYVYSFSLHPESFQPSGTCNMSRINKIELKTEIKKIPTDETYSYDMFVYVVNYNFLKITGGLAGIAFSS
tara:strand:+ start:1112 stop:2455 length:1344 start_codon:yes stop_codon:yes gene_type:complete